MNQPELIEREVRGNVVVLRMKHGKVNAMDLELCEALSHALDAVRQTQARAVVLTGSGVAFSAGVDLKRFVAAGAAYVEKFHPALCSVLEKVFLFPRPVVAAVNGHALAGGCLLACACDFRYLASGPHRMGAPEMRVGLPFPAIGIEVLRLVVPARMLRDVLYHGRTFVGEEAVQHGFADEIVAPEELLAFAVDEAERLGEHGDVFAATKDQLRARARQFLAAHGTRLDHHGLQIWRRPATIETVRNYIAQTLQK
jgi:enoyl-CoA hydratase